MDIFIDIETAPVESGQYLITDEETGEQKDIGALSPITGRIIAAGLIVGDKEYIFLSDDEREVLTNFWKVIEEASLANHGNVKLIGFNVKKFEIHYLIVRSLHLNIPVYKLTTKHVIDVREHLTFFQTYMKKGTLHDYAQLIGMPGKTMDIKGEDIPALWLEKKYDMLKNYLLQDLRITKELYDRCKKLGIIHLFM